MDTKVYLREKRHEYLVRLKSECVKVFLQVYIGMYKDVKEACKNPRFILREYQAALKNYAGIAQEELAQLFQQMEQASPHFTSLVTSIFKTYYISNGWKHVNLPAVEDYLNECRLVIARYLYKNPFIVYDVGVNSQTRKQNLLSLEQQIERSLEETFLKMLPLASFDMLDIKKDEPYKNFQENMDRLFEQDSEDDENEVDEDDAEEVWNEESGDDERSEDDGDAEDANDPMTESHHVVADIPDIAEHEEHDGNVEDEGESKCEDKGEDEGEDEGEEEECVEQEPVAHDEDQCEKNDKQDDQDHEVNEVLTADIINIVPEEHDEKNREHEEHEFALPDVPDGEDRDEVKSIEEEDLPMHAAAPMVVPRLPLADIQKLENPKKFMILRTRTVSSSESSEDDISDSDLFDEKELPLNLPHEQLPMVKNEDKEPLPREPVVMSNDVKVVNIEHTSKRTKNHGLDYQTKKSMIKKRLMESYRKSSDSFF